MASQNPIPTYFNPEIGPQYRGLSFEDVANSFNNGQQFSNQIQQQQQQGLLSRLLAQNTGQDGQVDLNKALEAVQANPNQANQPALVNTLSGLIQQREVARLKAQQEADKFKADNAKTTADAEEKAFGTTQNKRNVLNQVWQMAAKSGNANDVLLGLNSAKELGVITPEQYEVQANALKTMQPSDIQRFAGGLALSSDKDQAKYLFETPDNIRDNETSLINNAATVGVQNRKIEQDQQQFLASQAFESQKARIQQNKGELVTGADGNGYIFYPSLGKYEPALDAQGKQLAMPKKASPMNETPEQKMTRIDNALGSADAAKAAARASQDAATLINDIGLYWGTGTTSLLGSVPGTDAKAFQAKLENLKSQVFLPAVKALQGMGALSNAEGEKVSASIANLDPKIGPEAMKQQLSILAKQMSDAAKLANKRTQNYASRGGTIPTKNKPLEVSAPSKSSNSSNAVKDASSKWGI